MATWLVIGLGNPGDKYAATRHNVGQMVIDELARRHGVALKSHKTASRAADTRFSVPGDRVILAKPNSFMNLSGGATAGLAKFFDIPADHVIVLHDELDLPFDTVRIKVAGGHGGHNGLRDIISAIGEPGFVRVRVGIGRPPGQQDAADFVLRPFASVERDTVASLVSDAADAVEHIVAEGVTSAQNRVNTAAQ